MMPNIILSNFLKKLFCAENVLAFDYENFVQFKILFSKTSLYRPLQTLKKLSEELGFSIKVLLISSKELQVIVGSSDAVRAVSVGMEDILILL